MNVEWKKSLKFTVDSRKAIRIELSEEESFNSKILKIEIKQSVAELKLMSFNKKNQTKIQNLFLMKMKSDTYCFMQNQGHP